MECTPLEWLAVRGKLSAFASTFSSSNRKGTQAAFAFFEIARLDKKFGYVPGKPFQPGKVNESKEQPKTGFLRPGELVKFAASSVGPFTVKTVKFYDDVLNKAVIQTVTFEETPGCEYDSTDLKVFRYGEGTNG